MKSVFWFLFLAAIAVGLALLVGDNTATVTVFWHPWRVDLSLNLVLLLLLVGFVLLYLALRGVSILRNLPAQAQRWRATQQERAVYVSLLDAVVYQLAGRFVRAQSSAQYAVHMLEKMEPGVMGRPAQWRVLAQLLLAESSRSLGNVERQQLAMQAVVAESGKEAVPAQEGALLRAAAWAIDERDAEAAQGWMAQLPQGASRRIQALRLRLRLAQLERDSASAVNAVRLLAKYKAVSPAAADSLLRGLLKDALAQAHDREQLARTWKGFGAKERTDAGLALHCLERWQALSLDDDHPTDRDEPEERAFVLGLLEVLWASYTALTDSRRVRGVRCVEFHLPWLAHDWLPRIEEALQERPGDPALLYLAGQALMHCQLWGKAQASLGQAVRQLTDASLKRRAWRSLAVLADQKGEREAAAEAWRQAALCD